MATEIRYMLDTNTASYIIKGQPEIVKSRIRRIPLGSVCISSITQAELLFGVARKPYAKRLAHAVNEFLLWMDILPWNSKAAKEYAWLRTFCEKNGTSLGSMDMLIAAHSIAVDAVLISNDKAFSRVKKHLKLDDWTDGKNHN